MSADAEATLVRFCNDYRHQLGLHRAVNLNLHITEVGIAIYPLARFFRRRRKNLNRPFVWTRSVDKSRQHDARPYLLASLDVLFELAQLLDGIGKIASSCDSSSDVEKC